MGVWEQKEEIEKRGLKVIGLLHENVPEEVKAFLEGNFWGGPLYYDEKRTVFRSLGDGKVRRAGLYYCLSALFDYRTYLGAFVAIRKAGWGNLNGDGLVLGGTMIVGTDGTPCYSCQETYLGEKADLNEALAACSKCTGVTPSSL
eukprot:m.109235 g.109235  ORF g.109235 m.109235 type:complete len:145 (+) comp13997_c0_seq1:185-619(+)